MKSHPGLSSRAGVSSCRRATGLFVLLLVSAVMTNADEPVTPPAACAFRLIVELTPDVPDVRSSGFLSSLLGDHPGYQLTLRHVIDDTHLDVLLYGPGPKRNCRDVLDGMRKDARMQSIQVQ
jgi:hypothetical protein